MKKLDSIAMDNEALRFFRMEISEDKEIDYENGPSKEWLSRQESNKSPLMR